MDKTSPSLDGSLFPVASTRLARPVWPIGALCRAVADVLDARFNPVAVRGEISGFARATSGHCYFTLKDASGQIRCAMFRRSAGLLDFQPQDGELVEVRGRIGVYETRGDLQLVVESMERAGQGALYEQFLRLKVRLEGEGLFDASRKRPLPLFPRGIGVVSSLGAAAWHDVMTALRRRAPHIPVVLSPAAVQGKLAPAELVQALDRLNALSVSGQGPAVDVILLVRGGGSIEDLWAFNDEQLARALARSLVPVISGVGHETDFTIADFVADLRAPTPTAAAELAAQPRAVLREGLQALHEQLRESLQDQLDTLGQRLDLATHRLGRPSGLAARQRLMLTTLSQRLRHATGNRVVRAVRELPLLAGRLTQAGQGRLANQQQRLERAALRLSLLDPTLVLRRGYAWLSDPDGQTVSSVSQTYPGQTLAATLADGKVDLTVLPPA